MLLLCERVRERGRKGVEGGGGARAREKKSQTLATVDKKKQIFCFQTKLDLLVTAPARSGDQRLGDKLFRPLMLLSKGSKPL